MTELAPITVAEAIAIRDYPIILRDRRLLLSEQAMQLLVGTAAAASIGLYLTAAFWLNATRLQLHLFELVGVVAWGLFYLVLSELRRENIIELNATGLLLRPHTAARPIEIAWSDILLISHEQGDIFLVRRAEPPERQALLRELFGFKKLYRQFFGASLTDIHALLETHLADNTRPDKNTSTRQP